MIFPIWRLINGNETQLDPEGPASPDTGAAELESALDGYPGTFLLVTHDRRMLESVSVTRRLVVSDGQVTEVDVA